SDGAGDGRAHDAARRGALSVGHAPVAPECSRGSAAGAAVRGDRPRRRLHPVLGAPGLSSRAMALASARHSPLVPDSRLAGGIPFAPDRHRRDPRALVRAALRPGLRPDGALRLPRLRVLPRRLHPRQRAIRPRAARLAGGHATLPPLASRREPGGQELRGAPALARPALRHRLPARWTLAGGVRDRRASRTGGVLAPARLAASPDLETRLRRGPGPISDRRAGRAELGRSGARTRSRSPTGRSSRTIR